MFSRKTPIRPAYARMHLACGLRRVPGWLNVDLSGAEVNADLLAKALPFADGVFDAIVSQHLVEHLELETELIPVLRELRRVSKPGAEMWITCPDLEKICRFYVEDKGVRLFEYLHAREPGVYPADCPPQHTINIMFHQSGLHRNLYDFELLTWALEKAGFTDIKRVVEQDLLDRFPGFPPRGDDFETLCVCCRRAAKP